MKIAVVHNRAAGRNKLDIAALLHSIRDAGYQAQAVPLSDRLVHTPEIAGADLLVIAGGDGTIRKVALQFVGHSLPIAVLPTGTANNISQSLGVSGEIADLISNWKYGRTVGLDVGRVRGPWGESLFLEGIGIGLVGRSIGIVETIDEQSGREFSDTQDKLQRDLAVFIALAFELPAVHVECSADGEDMTADFLLLEILNIRHAGPRIHLAPHADPTDGLLDVVFAKREDREALKKTLLASLVSPQESTFLSKQKTREFRLNMKVGELRLDDHVVMSRSGVHGTQPDVAQIDVSVLHHALRMLVP
ncbi:MAG: diacylglycerol kinase family protein [Nibricoccus sp.]